MYDLPRSRLPKYAKYLPEYEPMPPVAQIKIKAPQADSYLHAACILLSFISGFTTAYLIASLIIVPDIPARSAILFWTELTWIEFGLLPGIAALVCWGIFRARQYAQP